MLTIVDLKHSRGSGLGRRGGGTPTCQGMYAITGIGLFTTVRCGRQKMCLLHKSCCYGRFKRVGQRLKTTTSFAMSKSLLIPVWRSFAPPTFALSPRRNIMSLRGTGLQCPRAAI